MITGRCDHGGCKLLILHAPDIAATCFSLPGTPNLSLVDTVLSPNKRLSFMEQSQVSHLKVAPLQVSNSSILGQFKWTSNASYQAHTSDISGSHYQVVTTVSLPLG